MKNTKKLYNKKFKKRKQVKSRNQVKSKNQVKSRTQVKSKNQVKSKKQVKNIKLIIKDLGKKTKKYKRIQYGCKKMSGGGPLFQPVTYVSRSIENTVNNSYNTMYGNNTEEYNYNNY